MNTSRKTLVAGLLAVMAVAPAFADKGGHGKGGGHDDDQDRVVQVERGDHDRRDDRYRGDERVVQHEPSQGRWRRSTTAACRPDRPGSTTA